MRVRVVAGETPRQLAAAVAAVGYDGFRPRLAIVFASVALDLDAIRAPFAAAGIDLFGASTAGEIAIDAAAAGNSVREQSAVALLLDVDPARFRLHLLDVAGRSSFDAGQAAGRCVASAFARPAALVMASGLTTDGEQIVNGILSQTTPDLPLYGGLAGDDTRFQDTYVFTAHQVAHQGVLLLVFDRDAVEIDGIASSGWTAVGGDRTVTKATGNVVQAIDGKPALDLYQEYLGVGDESSLILPEYPLQLQRDGYTVLRAPLLSDPDTRALVFAGTVPEGARVRFSCSPGVEIIERALTDIRTLHQRRPAADALLLFSCKGRHLGLGPMAEDEVAPIQRLWKAPLVGLYTYGEIGTNAAGACDFHNETCVLVTLREV